MKDGIHVFWLRNTQKHPVSCVASKLEGNTLRFSVATHNPHDKFNKKTGRNKALGRLQSATQFNTKNGELHHKTITLEKGQDPRVALLEAIASEPKFGISAQRCAFKELADSGVLAGRLMEIYKTGKF